MGNRARFWLKKHIGLWKTIYEGPAMNEQEIFASALEQEPDRRAAFLDEACRDDVQLRKRVEDLLRINEGGGAFFEKPAAEILATEQSPITGETRHPDRPLQATTANRRGRHGRGLYGRAE